MRISKKTRGPRNVWKMEFYRKGKEIDEGINW